MSKGKIEEVKLYESVSGKFIVIKLTKRTEEIRRFDSFYSARDYIENNGYQLLVKYRSSLTPPQRS